jgi:ankyrin repeat protein
LHEISRVNFDSSGIAMIALILELKRLLIKSSGATSSPKIQASLASLLVFYKQLSFVFNTAKQTMGSSNHVHIKPKREQFMNFFEHRHAKFVLAEDILNEIMRISTDDMNVNSANLERLSSIVGTLLAKSITLLNRVKGDAGFHDGDGRGVIISYLTQLICILRTPLPRTTPILPKNVDEQFATVLKKLMPYIEAVHERNTKKGQYPNPSCFLSYAWGNATHEVVVEKIAEHLELAGLEVYFDRWANVPGRQIQEFVSKVDAADWVVLLGSQLYQEKYNKRETSQADSEHMVRAEAQLMIAIANHSSKRKERIIPVLLEGTSESSLPQTFFNDKRYIDLSKGEYIDRIVRLIQTLYKISPKVITLDRTDGASSAFWQYSEGKDSNSIIDRSDFNEEREQLLSGDRDLAQPKPELLASLPSKKNLDRSTLNSMRITPGEKLKQPLVQNQRTTATPFARAKIHQPQSLDMGDSSYDGVSVNEILRSVIENSVYDQSMSKYAHSFHNRGQDTQTVHPLARAQQPKILKLLMLKSPLDVDDVLRFGVVNHHDPFVGKEGTSSDRERFGRLTIIQKIRTYFNTSMPVGQSISSGEFYTHAVLCGIGGVGKSMIAREYALQQIKAKTYELVCWFDASSEERLVQSMIEFVEDYFQIEVQSQPNLDLAGSLYKSLKPFQRCLFIFDGVDDDNAKNSLKKYLPSQYRSKIAEAKVVCNCLITSRRSDWENKIQITGYTDDEIEQWVDDNQKNESSREDCKLLAEALGYHPLALFHANNYISNKKCSVQDYLKDLESDPVKIFYDQDNQPATPDESYYKRGNIMGSLAFSVASYIAWTRTCSNPEMACEILACLGICQQTTVLKSYIGSLVFVATSKEHIGQRIVEVSRHLEQYAVLQKSNSKENRLEIHKFMQEIIKHYSEPNAVIFQRHAQALLSGFNYSYEKSGVQPGQHYDWWITEIKAVLVAAEGWPDDLELREVCARLQQKLGDYYLFWFRMVDEAFVHYRAALSMSRKTSLEDNMAWQAKTGNGLGFCYYIRGQYVEAEKRLKEILKQLQEPEPPLVLTTLEGVFARRTMGLMKASFEVSEAYYQQCLTYYEGSPENLNKQLTREEAYELSLVYVALGDLQRKMEKNQEAINFYIKAVDLEKDVTHADTVITLSKIAKCYEKLNNYSESFEYHRQSYDMANSLFRLQSPVSYVSSCYKWAAFYQKMPPRAASSSEKKTSEVKEIDFDDILKIILDNNLLPEDSDLHATPLLHLAIRYGHLDYLEMLIETKALDWQLEDKAKMIPLVSAAARGQLDVVKLLLAEDSVVVNITNRNGFTPLLAAMYKKHDEVAECLIAAGADVAPEDTSGNTALHFAAQNGSKAIAERLLELNPGINALNGQGETALIIASHNGHIDVVRLLLLREADASIRDAVTQSTALLHAVQEDFQDVVRALLAFSKDEIDEANPGGTTPLLDALGKKHVEVAMCLLDEGANPTKADEDGDAALHLAARKGCLAVVERIIEIDAVDINARGAKGFTPLMQASASGHITVAKCLLDKGAEVTTADENGDAALHLAARKGYLAIVTRIIRIKEVDINAHGAMGYTPLMQAAAGGHVAVVQFLLSEPDIELDKTSLLHSHAQKNLGDLVRLNETDSSAKLTLSYLQDRINGQTALMLALRENHKEVVEHLLDAGADASLKDGLGNTSLHMAALSGSLFFISHLLSTLRLDINEQNNQGATALIEASRTCQVEVVRCLIEHGADVSKQDATIQGTALWHAAYNGHFEVVKVLLEKSRDELNAGSKRGMTPLFVALNNEHVEVANYLLELGADVALADIDGATALHLAAGSGLLSCVDALLARDTVAIDAANHQGATALITAARRDRADVVRLLILRGADVSKQDAVMLGTALLHAAYNGHLSVVKVLLEASRTELNAMGQGCSTPLLVALNNEHIEVANYLLEAGAGVTLADVNGDTALHLAAAGGLLSCVETLLAQDTVAIDATSHQGATALIAAARRGQVEVVRLLMSREVDASKQDTQNQGTALLHAAYNGHLDVVKVLLEASKAELNVMGQQGITPLLAALNKEHIEISTYLLESGADVALAEENGDTALHIAAQKGYATLVDHMLQMGDVDVNASGLMGLTPLMQAATNGHESVVGRLLLVPDIQLNSQTKAGSNELARVMEQAREAGIEELSVLERLKSMANGHTALMLAVMGGHTAVVEQLLAVGVDPTLVDGIGNTVLHLAARRGILSLVDRLLALGVLDISALNTKGASALCFALDGGHSEVVNCLLSAGADADVTSADADTLLHLAAGSGLLSYVTSFLEQDAVAIDAANHQGATALITASRRGRTEVVRLLISRGAEVSKQDTVIQGTALLHAACSGHLDTVKVLLEASRNELNLMSKRRMTPLLGALNNEHVEVANYLLESGANTVLVDADGDTVLHLAAGNGLLPCVASILEQDGVAVDATNHQGATALITAARGGQVDVVCSLISHGADASKQDSINQGTALLHAAHNGHLDVVKALLEVSKTELNTVGQQRSTPLFVALNNKHVEVANYLLESGADAMLTDDDGDTALHFAAGRGLLPCVALLLAQDAVVIDAENHQGATALIFAARRGRVDVVRLLVSRGADTSKKDITNQGTALLHATHNGHLGVVKVLLEASKAELDVMGQKAITPLLVALNNEHIEIATYLFELGADVTLADEDGDTALHLAAQKGCVTLVERILQVGGVEVNAPGFMGLTPLMQAATTGHARVAGYLLLVPNIQLNRQTKAGLKELAKLTEQARKAEVEVEEPYVLEQLQGRASGHTALMLAVIGGHAEVAEQFLAVDADPRLADGVGNTVLHLAAQCGMLSLVERLLALGVLDVNTLNAQDASALLLALQGGHIEVVNCLLAAGADVTFVDKDGDTALHLAVMGGELALVRRLLDLNLNTTAPNLRGFTPLMLAIMKVQIETVDCLLSAEADVTHVDADGNTVLHLAAGSGLLTCVTSLLAQDSVAIDTANHQGATALIIAARRGQVDVVRSLIAHGADASKQDSVIQGTALLHAAYNGHLDVVKALLETSITELNVIAQQRMTPLLVALYNGHVEVANYLLESGANATLVDADGDAALHFAAGSGLLTCVAALSELGTVAIDTVNHQGATALITAARRGQADVVKLLIERGADTSKQDTQIQGTALLHAAYSGHLDVVKVLLEASKAELDVTGQQGMMPLLVALNKEHAEIATYLFESGADITLANEGGDTALHLAAQEGYVTLVERMLQVGAVDVNASGLMGFTPLMQAATNGHASVVGRLLLVPDLQLNRQTKADSNELARLVAQAREMGMESQPSLEGLQRGATGHTALMLAVMGGHTAAAEQLLAASADPKLVDGAENTVLHLAARRGMLSFVERLLALGDLDVNTLNAQNASALLLALQGGHIGVVNCLLAAGADVTFVDEDGDTALHLAVMGGELALVRRLLGLKLNIDATNLRGVTPLMLAIMKEQVEIVDCLLSAAADVTHVDADGDTVLHLAAGSGLLTCVTLLLAEDSVAIDAANHQGATALITAARRGRVDVVRSLISHGADASKQDSAIQGTALLHATYTGHLDVVIVLLEASRNELNIAGQRGAAPLLVALNKEHVEVANYLLESGADVTLADAGGDTALHLAAGSGLLTCVTSLLAQDTVAIDTVNHQGATALITAARRGRVDVAKLLIERGADTSKQDTQVQGTALLHAAYSGHLDVVKVLLEASKAELNTMGQQTITPLLGALNKEHVEIATYLLASGADITLADEDGDTVLHLAAQKGYVTLVERMLQIGGAEVNAPGLMGLTPLMQAATKGHVRVVGCLLLVPNIQLNRQTKAGPKELAKLTEQARLAGAEVEEPYVLEQLQRRANGHTALMLAVIGGHAEVAEQLLAASADPKLVDGVGNTVLHLAAQCGMLSFVERLLALGILDINTLNAQDASALLLALHGGHIEVVNCLLAAGADVTFADKDGDTALHLAVMGGELALVRRLLGLNLNIDATNLRGLTPLMQAIMKEQVEIVDGLLSAEADVTHVDADGDTVLHLAAGSGLLTCVTSLLAQDTVAIDTVNHQGATALISAARRGRVDVVRSLISHRADASKQDSVIQGTALLHAAGNGHLDVVIALLEASRNEINIAGQRYATPLLVALNNEHVEVANYLLESGADVMLADADGDTALHLAAGSGLLTSVTSSLAQDTVAIDVANHQGATALINAARRGRADVVKLLIEGGADTSKQDIQSQGTALLHAAYSGHLDVVKVLLETSNAELNTMGQQAITPLLGALNKEHVEIATYLVASGADITLADEDGDTALHLAAQKGYVTLVECMLQVGGVEVNAPGLMGLTPLMHAATKGHASVVGRLLLVPDLQLNRQTKAGSNELVRFVEQAREAGMGSQSSLEGLQRRANGHTALMLAVMGGHTAAAEQLLAASADPKLVDGVENTVLHLAARCGMLSLVERLLALGDLDINTLNAQNASALLLALQGGHIEVVNCLLAAGADVTFADEDGDTALHLAVIGGELALVRRLLGLNLNIDATNLRGLTPLMLAIMKEQVEIVDCLLSAEADAMHVDADGDTVLHLAAGSGLLTCVTLLLAQDSLVIDVANHQGATALIAAARRGRVDVVRSLISHGADASKQDSVIQGTALLHAAGNGHLDVVIALLEASRNELNIAGQRDATPLLVALNNEHVEVASYLLESGVDVTLADADGDTALHLAAGSGLLTCVTSLLAQDTVAIDEVNHQGETALITAARRGRADVVNLLIERDADTSKQDTQAQGTALLHAANSGHLDVVKLLLAASNAELNVMSQRGMTPLLVALNSEHVEVVNYLLESGADITLADADGDTALHFAVTAEDITLVECLLAQEAINLNAQNDQSLTPLMFAFFRQKLNIVEYLILAGADVSVANRDNNTVLHLGAMLRVNLLDEVLELLCQRQQRVRALSLPNHDGNTPIHLAMRLKNYSVIKKMLKLLGEKEAAYVLTLPNINGSLPWEVAVQYQNIAVLEKVLNYLKPSRVSIGENLDNYGLLMLCLLVLHKSPDVNSIAQRLAEQGEEMQRLIEHFSCNDVSTNHDLNDYVSRMQNLLVLHKALARLSQEIQVLNLVSCFINHEIFANFNLSENDLEQLLRVNLLAKSLPQKKLTLMALLINTGLFDKKLLLNLLQKVERDSKLILCLFPLNPSNDLLLHALCKQNNHKESAVLLAEILNILGEDVEDVINNPNPAGETPLHVAARMGNHKAAKVLLANGANNERQNLEGKTPQQVASYPEKFLVLARGHTPPSDLSRSLTRIGGLFHADSGNAPMLIREPSSSTAAAPDSSGPSSSS